MIERGSKRDFIGLGDGNEKDITLRNNQLRRRTGEYSFTDNEFSTSDEQTENLLTRILDSDPETLNMLGIDEDSEKGATVLEKWSIAFTKKAVPQIDVDGKPQEFMTLGAFISYLVDVMTPRSK